MKRFLMLLVAAGFGLLVSIAEAKGKQSGHRHVRLEADGIVRASAMADEKKMSELTEHEKENKYIGLFSSALSYSQFNFAKSEAQARECFNVKDDGFAI